jgi:hypothetical protein
MRKFSIILAALLLAACGAGSEVSGIKVPVEETADEHQHEHETPG